MSVCPSVALCTIRPKKTLVKRSRRCFDRFSAGRFPCNCRSCPAVSSSHLARLRGFWRLSQTSGFTLGLEEAENVVLADCCSTYHVSKTPGSCIDHRCSFPFLHGGLYICVPGPLTLRMIERVWSSMNSTRTWVTPPREPSKIPFLSAFFLCAPLLGFPFALLRISTAVLPSFFFFFFSSWGGSSGHLFRTGTAEDAGDLHQLDGLLRGIHCD